MRREPKCRLGVTRSSDPLYLLRDENARSWCIYIYMYTCASCCFRNQAPRRGCFARAIKFARASMSLVKREFPATECFGTRRWSVRSFSRAERSREESSRD